MTGKYSTRHGFSLIELLMVVAILGFLAMATVPIAELSYIREKEVEFEGTLRLIRSAIRAWRNDCERQIRKVKGIGTTTSLRESLFYPPDIGSLTKSIPYTIDLGAGVFTFFPKPYLDEIPPDPFAGGPVWVQYYASATANASSVYSFGKLTTDASINTASGVFDVSCHYDISRRKGFEIAVDGTKYFDW